MPEKEIIFTNYLLSWCWFSLCCCAECTPGAVLTWVSFLQAHSSLGKPKASDTSGSCRCLECDSRQKRGSLSESNRWTLLRNRFVPSFQQHSFSGEVGEVLMTVVTVTVFAYWKRFNSFCDIKLGHCRVFWCKVIFQTDKFAFAEEQIYWNIEQSWYCSKLLRTNLPFENHLKRCQWTTKLVWSGVISDAWTDHGFPSQLNMDSVEFGGGVVRFFYFYFINKFSLHTEILTLNTGWISWSWERTLMTDSCILIMQNACLILFKKVLQFPYLPCTFSRIGHWLSFPWVQILILLFVMWDHSSALGCESLFCPQWKLQK